MEHKRYRFAFDNADEMVGARAALRTAFIAVAAIYGRTALMLDTLVCWKPRVNVIEIDASTLVGRKLACVFAGLCTHEFGDGAFRVEAVRPATPVGTVAA